MLEYYSAVKKTEIKKSSDKWIELEKNYTKQDNSGPDRQILYVLSHVLISSFKSFVLLFNLKHKWKAEHLKGEKEQIKGR